MRHGEAERFRVPDETRSLTQVGENQAKVAGQWLTKQLGPSTVIDIALVSSYIRAKQTFKHLTTNVQVSDTQTCKDIVPDGNPKIAHDFVQALANGERPCNSLLIVSHMPFVSYFLEEVHIHKQSMLFDTSSMVIVDYNPITAMGEIDSIYHPV
jgi:phosphohistidine phosphatase